MSPETEYYFERFGFCGSQISEAPHPDLGMVVVIPSYNEPDLIGALNSLRVCEAPGCAVEIIVVVNSGENAPREAISQNKSTVREAEEWINTDSDSSRRFHLIHCVNLPRKKAGVGLARKIGMDEALRRLDRVGRVDGPIVCFDADCSCDPNYLRVLEEYFNAHPKSPGCSIYFEHPLGGGHNPAVYEGIILYELHLRYYVQALRWAKYPFGYHTIGSSMAVRGEVYRKQGGMNKRQAGEDFYFLHKVIPLGNFGDLTSTTVHASPRPSERVPFGTGRAVREFLERGKHGTYPLEAFEDLRNFLKHVDEMQPGNWQNFASEPLNVFLRGQEFDLALAECREQSGSIEAFRKRFFWWLDGFRVMKFVHHARDTIYGVREITFEAQKLWREIASEPAETNARELLLKYREWERNNSW